MNPPANSTELQVGGGDPGCWASAHDQGWDHPVAAVCCGLDSRHFQASRPEWEWENPIVLAQHSIDHHQELSDCKPHHVMLQGEAIATDLRHYGGNNMLSNRFPPHISHNAWGLLNGATLRNGGEGIETPTCPVFPSSSSAFYGGLGNSALTEFYAGNGGYGETRSPFEQHRHLLGLMSFDQRLMHDIAQRDVCTADFTARLGLNLGARTYFSAEDSGLVRFGKRLRPNSPGLQIPLCQAEGCKADLSIAKHYHRRHKVCEFHSKAATVIIGGQTQRFCQQCSRFHVLSEFDEGKRSCRKRLADHNRRRRKPQPNASGSPTTEKPAQKSDEQERVEGDTSSNGSQIKSVSGSDNVQVSVSAISLAPSAPVPVKNEKRQLSTHSASNEKEAYQQFMQGQRTGPSLSLSTFGGGTTIASQGQSPGKGFGGADLPVAWLKPVESNSNLMESLSRSSMSMQTLSGSSSPSRRFVEPLGNSSSMQGLPHTMPKSLSLTSLRDPVGNLDWILKNISDQGNEQLGEFGSSNVNLQVKSEAQEVLSLLEGGPVRKVEAAENHIQQTARAPLEFLQHNLPSTINVNESDHAIADQNQTNMKFSGLQALMPFNPSIYNSADNVL